MHTSVQTELNIEEIYIKEHQNELFSNELKLTKLRDKEKLVARENDLIRREQDL